MRLLFLTLILVFIAVPFLFCQNIIRVPSGEVLENYTYFLSQYPRLEGSPQERNVRFFLKGKLTQKGIPFEEQDFKETEGKHSFSSNLNVFIPGLIEDTLIIAVPLCQSRGATPGTDGSISLALALALIEEFSYQKPAVSLRFLFLTGDYQNGKSYPIGIERFLEDFYPEKQTAVIFLNLPYIPKEIVIRSGAKYLTAPYWLINSTSLSLDKTDLNYRLTGNEHQVFRLGLTDLVTPIQPFLNEGYPSLEFLGSSEILPDDRVESWIFSFILFADNFVQSLGKGFPEEWDRHFLFFKFGNAKLIIKENVYLIILYSVFSLFFLYAIIFRERLAKYLMIMLRHIGTIPVLYLFIFLCLLLSTFFLESLGLIKNYPNLWQKYPIVFFSIKISTALFLFFLVFRFLRKRVFSFRGSFYSASAMFFLIITTVTTAVINISFSYYFIWAFIWTFIFSLLRNRLLKFFCLCISPVFLFIALYDVFARTSFRVIEFLLISRLSGNLIFALFVLPFALMLIRLSLLYKHSTGGKHRIRNIILLSLLGAATLSLSLYISFSNPFKYVRQKVIIEEKIDLEKNQRRLTLRSEAPLGRITFSGEGYPEKIDTQEREITIGTTYIPAMLEINKDVYPFLDRQNIVLTLSALGNPSSVLCRIEGGDSLVLFDANFPFSLLPGSNTWEVHIGRNPPNPLVLDCILPRGEEIAFRFELIYEERPFPSEIVSKNKDFSGLLKLESEIVVIEAD